jgi:hypothetical protein
MYACETEKQRFEKISDNNNTIIRDIERERERERERGGGK